MADVDWNLYDELMMRLYDNRNSLEFDTWQNFTESISKLGGGYWGSGEDEAFYGRGVAQLLADKYAVDLPSVDPESAPMEADAMVLLMRKVIESEPYGLGFWRPDGDQALFASSRDADTWYEDYEEMLAGEGLGEPAADEQAEAAAAEEEEEVIKPYGLGYMKLVDGRWLFGSTEDAEKWYADYDEMLVRERVEAEPAAKEIIEPYGLGYMKAVEGQWKFASDPQAGPGKWYDDYIQMLEAEGLSQPVAEEEELAGPVHVPEVVEALEDPALREELEREVDEDVDEVMIQARQMMDENSHFAALGDELAQIAAEVLGVFSQELSA